MEGNFSHIDHSVLFSLYGRDKDCLLDVFRSALHQLTAELPVLQGHKEEKDFENLERAVRRIRPLFGFTGLTGMHQECKIFEEKCRQRLEDPSLESDYLRFISLVLESTFIIEKEIGKLRA